MSFSGESGCGVSPPVTCGSSSSGRPERPPCAVWPAGAASSRPFATSICTSFRYASCSVLIEDSGKPLGCCVPPPMTHERRLPLPSPYFFGFSLNSTAISRAMSDHVRFFFASFSDAAAAAPLPHTLDQSMRKNCSQRLGRGAGRSSRTFRSVAGRHRGRLPCRAEGLVPRRGHSSGCCARARPSRSARAARRAARRRRWRTSPWPAGVGRYLAG